MLQGHDPLITENNNKKRGRHKQSESFFLPFLQLTRMKKKNAAFQAQLSTCKNKTKRRIIE